MVVEDDNSLREIYKIRLTAEGYEIAAAADGEEALAVAVKEKPDLILADVMMPKISGFDMLDILRQTPETKDVKVVMMTALSSEEQRDRGRDLGADRYLVKSQVGIEDVINTIHEVLGDKSASSSDQPSPAPAQPEGDETLEAVPEMIEPAQPEGSETLEAVPEMIAPARPVSTEAIPEPEQPLATGTEETQNGTPEAQ